ncbi:MAG TPA: hypothetical protein ENI26_06930 [Methylophaga aminisulfidivorans]|uniref:Calcineurin-like phosphoesterase domain-containing protein n=1 Tax=Methylophaga aminisulfidivorans TaxID=230105 RepID=A0A7C2AB80_9GAMM|nr:hypothetical protein [Methylophaga aminisulfidivorans]
MVFLRYLLLCYCLLSISLAFAIESSGKTSTLSHRDTIKVALWGDQFYNDDPIIKHQEVNDTIDSMNQHDIDFTLFIGDSKSGHSPCTDKAIGEDIKTIFNRLIVPTIYTPGDNEWTDCHRINNGEYDPLERLTFLRHYFFTQAYSQGKTPIALKRQGSLGKAYSENGVFNIGNVSFVTVHIVGSNNNLATTDADCFRFSHRRKADCAKATTESKARSQKVIEWLNTTFAEANKHQQVGIVIAMHANPYFPIELAGNRYHTDFLPSLDANNGFTDFFHALIQLTHTFKGEVLLVHGDSHYFRVDKPMLNEDGSVTKNFSRVEVFGDKDNSWVELTIDKKAETLFSIRPVILPN